MHLRDSYFRSENLVDRPLHSFEGFSEGRVTKNAHNINFAICSIANLIIGFAYPYFLGVSCPLPKRFRKVVV
jgi:hypothetical protein